RVHVISGGVDGILNVITGTDARASSRITVGYHPSGVGIDTRGTVFVAIGDASSYQSRGPRAHIVAIDPGAKALSRKIEVPVSSGGPMRIDPAGRLIVASSRRGTELLDIAPY